jgi:serine/alanine adding enzyme
MPGSVVSAEPPTDGHQSVEHRCAGPITVERTDDGVAWDQYIERHPAGTIDHLWGWRDVLRRALGHEAVYLVARRGPSIKGVLPLVLVRSRIFGRSVVSMPFLNYGGILADDSDVVEARVDAARDIAVGFRASHVELRHVQRQCSSLPSRRHKLSMTLALTGSTDQLWASLDRKVRNQVRKAQKSGLDVVSGGAELVDEFYGVFAHNMRDLGTPVYPKRLFEETLTSFSSQARVVVVRHQRRAVAAGISMRFGSSVLNPWASSLREARPLNPNMLLYWTMLEAAIAGGADVFDFGRSSPGGGTHQFKLQWGAVASPLCWEYVLLSRQEAPDQGPTNPKFARLISMWQKLPLWVANGVGPVIARHLP